MNINGTYMQEIPFFFWRIITCYIYIGKSEEFAMDFSLIDLSSFEFGNILISSIVATHFSFLLLQNVKTG